MAIGFKAALCAAACACAQQAEAANFLVVDIFATGTGTELVGSRSGAFETRYRPLTEFSASLAYYLDGPMGPQSTADRTFVVGSITRPLVTGTFTAAGFGFAATLPLMSFETYSLTGSACYANSDPSSVTLGQPALDPSCSNLKVNYGDGFAIRGFDFTGTISKINFRVVEADTLPSSTLTVPEPSTWALMLAGFGLTGYALRRRRSRVGFTALA